MGGLSFENSVGDLSNQSLRDILPELYICRHGILGDVLVAIFKNNFFRFPMVHFHIRLQHYEDYDFLHLVKVRNAYASAHVHQLVSVDYILYSGWIYLVGAGDYHSLDSLVKRYKALIIHHAEISGMYPSQSVFMMFQGTGNFLRIAYKACGVVRVGFNKKVRHFAVKIQLM